MTTWGTSKLRLLTVTVSLLFAGVIFSGAAHAQTTTYWFDSDCYGSTVDCWSTTMGQGAFNGLAFDNTAQPGFIPSTTPPNPPGYGGGDCSNGPCYGGYFWERNVPYDGTWCTSYDDVAGECLPNAYGWEFALSPSNIGRTNGAYVGGSWADVLYPWDSNLYGSNPQLVATATQSNTLWGAGDYHAYLCWELGVPATITHPTGYDVELCEETWRSDSNPLHYTQEQQPACNGNNHYLQVQLHWPPQGFGLNKVHAYGTNVGAYEGANNTSTAYSYGFSVSASQFRAALQNAPSGCPAYDTTPSDYQLGTVETGLEGSGQATQGENYLAGFTSW